MSPCLKDCPSEIIEAIVVLLDLVDIRSLRQSCRSLAVKSTQDRFKSYYHSKRVEITPHALRAFVDATQPGRLGCLVQELILVGLTNDAGGDNSPQQVQTETELDLLTQAFNGIAANGRSGAPLSLSLKVAVVPDGTEERILPVAGPQAAGDLSGSLRLRHFIQRLALWRQADYRLRSSMCLIIASCSLVALLPTSCIELTF
jgi:hypothetical protein